MQIAFPSLKYPCKIIFFNCEYTIINKNFFLHHAKSNSDFQL